MKIFFLVIAVISFFVSLVQEEFTSKAGMFLFATSSACAVALKIIEVLLNVY